MKMLTKQNKKDLPKLYSQDGKGKDAIVHVKFFTPWSNWTWYATEGEPILDDDGNEIDYKFFGLVDGHEKELGYWLLSQLTEVRGPFGLTIERDMYFTKKPVREFI